MRESSLDHVVPPSRVRCQIQSKPSWLMFVHSTRFVFARQPPSVPAYMIIVPSTNVPVCTRTFR